MHECTNAKRARATGRLLLLGLLLAAACEDTSSSKGTLVVPFELGNHRKCDTFDVAMIRAELDDGMYEEEAPCGNGQVRFKQIPAGSYHARMYGLNDDGVAVMDSMQNGDTVVNVIGDDTTVVVHPALTLTAAPAHLFLRWNFGFGTCKGAGIDQFLVQVWREGGDNLLLEASLDCETEGEGPDQYRQVPDDSRALGGDEVGEVSVQPLDKTGIDVGDPVMFKFDAPGPGRAIKLSMVCMDGACMGSGEPD